ncbi:MAG: hypothetical protein JXB88_11240 [Spirochaetales bacterium]|nr:hypothetical protein [Spirochaetales bacterium]
MDKEKSKELKKNRWNYSTIFILITFLTFFLFPLLSFRTDSMTGYVRDYYIQFMTGNLLIHHDKSPIPDLIMMPRISQIDDRVSLSGEYASIEKYLAGNNEIVSFTPFSLDPVTCMNKNKGKLSFWLKTIEPESFFDVFPQNDFSHTGNSPIDDIKGIFLPRPLVHRIEDLLNTPLTEGDFLFISNDSTRISSVREMVFSGIVSSRGYYTIVPWIAYTGRSSFPFQTRDHESDEEKKKANISHLNLPGEDEFYRDFITTGPSIQNTILPDSYFFNFFTYKRKAYGEENSSIPRWQYIAVSIRKKDKEDEVIENFKRYVELNSFPVTISSWQEAAGSIPGSIHNKGIGNGIITFSFLLILFFLSLHMSRNYARLLKRKDRKADTHIIVNTLKETTIRLTTGSCIAALTGILASVIAVQIINAFVKSPGGNGWNTIFPGSNGFLISLSPGPFFASLLILVILIMIITVYPLIILAGNSRQTGTGREK